MGKSTDESASTIKDLRTYMYNQIDKLNDPSADLDKELKKANALTNIGTTIINSIKAETDFRRQLLSEKKFDEEKTQQKQIGDGNSK
jgi:hypothetical protein